jgi:hypothetical protein
MKKILAAAAFASLAGLTGCSISTPAPVGPESSETPTGTAESPTASPSKSSRAAATGGAKAACELFNSLFAQYRAVPEGDANAYEAVYLASEDAKDTVSGDLRGLFAALSLLAIDHSSVAKSGGAPEQESKDAIRDAVFANAGTCTAEGVTLRL